MVIIIISGKFVLQVEARDGLGTGPFTDHAEIVIDIQSINNHRPVITNPALTNSSVDIQGVRYIFNLLIRFIFMDELIYVSDTYSRKLFGFSCQSAR